MPERAIEVNKALGQINISSLAIEELLLSVLQ